MILLYVILVVFGFQIGFMWCYVRERVRIQNYFYYMIDNSEYDRRLADDICTGIVLDEHHKLARGELLP